MIKYYHDKRKRRQVRVRSKIYGTTKRPRIAVFRSNRYIAAQIIDDIKGRTLASAHSKTLTEEDAADSNLGWKIEEARQTGMMLAKQAQKMKIKMIVFDRRSYRYHGRVKALAEGLREGGLVF